MTSSGAIRPARAPPSIDMFETVMRPSIGSARIASPAYSTTWPFPPPVPLLPDHRRGSCPSPSTPRAGRPSTSTRSVFGALLRQRLRREHVLDLARADAERQRAERAVCRRVRVAADDRHPRRRHAELRADHVHDPLTRVRRGRERTPNSSTFSRRARRAAAGDALVDRADRPRSARCGRPSRTSGRARRTPRPATRRPSNACGLVTSCTRCRSMNRRSSPIGCSSQILSAIVLAVICESLSNERRAR